MLVDSRQIQMGAPFLVDPRVGRTVTSQKNNRKLFKIVSQFCLAAREAKLPHAGHAREDLQSGITQVLNILGMHSRLLQEQMLALSVEFSDILVRLCSRNSFSHLTAGPCAARRSTP